MNICRQCKRPFDRTYSGNRYISYTNYKKRKFCSRKCVDKWRSKIGIRGSKNPNWKGGHFCQDCNKKLCSTYKSKRCRECWKKSIESTNYSALHQWVYRQKGAPMICQNCKRKITNRRFIHWANKSGKYLRDLSDWIRLCAKCHKVFDRK